MKSITLKATVAVALVTLFGTAATFQSVSADDTNIRAIPGLKLITMQNQRSIKRLSVMTCKGRTVTMWGTSGAYLQR